MLVAFIGYPVLVTSRYTVATRNHYVQNVRCIRGKTPRHAFQIDMSYDEIRVRIRTYKSKLFVKVHSFRYI